MKMSRHNPRLIPPVFILIVLLCSQAVCAQVPDDLSTEAGSVLLKDYIRDGVTIGQYWQYLPTGAGGSYAIPMPIGSNPMPIVVLVHGSIKSLNESMILAERYLRRYLPPNGPPNANTDWFMIIAPLFKSADFNGPFGGYRGMIGRHRPCLEPRKSDADAFVNGILDAYQHKHPEIFARKALFYGHSAGGQFLSRYLVAHPHRVAAMVISSAGTYAFPDSTKAWTDGMGTRTATITWSPTVGIRNYAFYPARWKFKTAAKLPVTVIVGDNESCNCVPESSNTPGFDDDASHCYTNPTPPPNVICTSAWTPTGEGTNYLRGQLWVEAMRNNADLPDTNSPDFDPSNPGVLFQNEPGGTHASADTQPTAYSLLISNRPTSTSIDWLGSALTPTLMSTIF